MCSAADPVLATCLVSPDLLPKEPCVHAARLEESQAGERVELTAGVQTAFLCTIKGNMRHKNTPCSDG